MHQAEAPKIYTAEFLIGLIKSCSIAHIAEDVLSGTEILQPERPISLNTIQVSVSLYGSIARYGGGHHVSSEVMELPKGSTKGDLIRLLGIPETERGYLFVNAVLFDVPDLYTGRGIELRDGDHVGIFAYDRVWPYQYRDGVQMTEELKRLMEEHGAMHHSYKSSE